MHIVPGSDDHAHPGFIAVPDLAGHLEVDLQVSGPGNPRTDENRGARGREGVPPGYFYRPPFLEGAVPHRIDVPLVKSRVVNQKIIGIPGAEQELAPGGTDDGRLQSRGFQGVEAGSRIGQVVHGIGQPHTGVPKEIVAL